MRLPDEPEPEAKPDLVPRSTGDYANLATQRDIIFAADPVVRQWTRFAEPRPEILTGTCEGPGSGAHPAAFRGDGKMIEPRARRVGRQRNVVRISKARH